MNTIFLFIIENTYTTRICTYHTQLQRQRGKECGSRQTKVGGYSSCQSYEGSQRCVQCHHDTGDWGRFLQQWCCRHPLWSIRDQDSAIAETTPRWEVKTQQDTTVCITTRTCACMRIHVYVCTCIWRDHTTYMCRKLETRSSELRLMRVTHERKVKHLQDQIQELQTSTANELQNTIKHYEIMQQQQKERHDEALKRCRGLSGSNLTSDDYHRGTCLMSSPIPHLN